MMGIMCLGRLIADFIGHLGPSARQPDQIELIASQFVSGLDLAVRCALDRDPMQRYRSRLDVLFDELRSSHGDSDQNSWQ